MAKKFTAENQKTYKALPVGIGLRHSGNMGQNAPRPLSDFKPIKYATQGAIPVKGKLI